MREGGYTLITGGAGFVGSNLADALLSDGERVVVFDNLSRPGVRANVDWLCDRHGDRVVVEVGDVTDAVVTARLVRGARRVYHLAAQVAVTTSIDDPRHDLHTNLLGTFNVLEAARSSPVPPSVLFASTNKVYGRMDDVDFEKVGEMYGYISRVGIDESAPLDFHSPYGCSKGAADQYVLDYARIYGVPTVVIRMSCAYGTRQFGTEDQGWIAHFAKALLAGEPITIYGDGCQVRDILWIGDLVEAMRLAADHAVLAPGEVFNIGGGPRNAVSVRQVIDRLMEVTDRRVPIRSAPWRPGDQRVYVSDTTRALHRLGWRPSTHWADGLRHLVEWLDDGRYAPAIPRQVSEVAL